MRARYILAKKSPGGYRVIHRPRACFLFVASLLAWVTTASAECAWVLWVGEWYDAGNGHPWSVLHAGAAQEDCLDAMRRAAEAYKDKIGSGVQVGRDPRDPWAVMVFGKG